MYMYVEDRLMIRLEGCSMSCTKILMFSSGYCGVYCYLGILYQAMNRVVCGWKIAIVAQMSFDLHCHMSCLTIYPHLSFAICRSI